MKFLRAPADWLRDAPVATKLGAVVVVFVGLFAAMLTIVMVAAQVATGTRAYVGGEGLWSKGQKDAVYYLARYVRSHDEVEFAKYEQAIRVPLGDRKARLELQKPRYDPAVVEQGFVEGGNAAEDVPAMIFLFRRFGGIGHMKQAIAVWAEADRSIDALLDCAREARAAPGGDPALLDRIERINIEATVLEHEFSATLGEGARWVGDVVLLIIASSSLLLLATGLGFSWWIARELRTGLQILRAGAVRFAGGDLSRSLEVRSRDELGDLALVFNDMVAQRRHAEEDLRASTDLARSIIDTAYDAYIAMDSEGLVRDWNRQAEVIFGWTREEVLGQPLGELIIPPAQRQAHSEGLTRYLATGEGPVLSRRIELSALHRDGRTFPVELTVWVTHMGDVPRFNAFLHDISERHRMVDRLAAQKSAAAALLEAKTLAGAAPEFLRAIAEALHWDVGALWMFDGPAGVLRCAEIWHRRDRDIPDFEAVSRRMTFDRGTGLPGRVWQDGKPCWIADVMRSPNFARAPEARRDRLHGAFGFPIFGGGAFLGVVEFLSHEVQQPDPDLLRMMDTLGSLLGQFIGRERAESELAQHAQELARSNAELEQFAYVASHDLQEPLRTVSGYAQLLGRRYRGRLGDDADEFIGFMTGAVERMRDLIQGLLAYSRASRSEAAAEPADLNGALQTAIANLQRAIETSGARVTHDALPALRISPREITQVFQNLIGNALKFQSTEPPVIHVAVEEGGAQWLFSVRDNGIGIDPQYADRIFALFQRLHTIDQYPGNGLGLAICKKIVEHHGGRIWVEPAGPHRGSVFRFTLPAG